MYTVYDRQDGVIYDCCEVIGETTRRLEATFLLTDEELEEKYPWLLERGREKRFGPGLNTWDAYEWLHYFAGGEKKTVFERVPINPHTQNLIARDPQGAIIRIINAGQFDILPT